MQRVVLRSRMRRRAQCCGSSVGAESSWASLAGTRAEPEWSSGTKSRTRPPGTEPAHPLGPPGHRSVCRHQKPCFLWLLLKEHGL